MIFDKLVEVMIIVHSNYITIYILSYCYILIHYNNNEIKNNFTVKINSYTVIQDLKIRYL